MFTLFLMLGCATGDTGNDSSTTCDETNEACAPGTCGGEGGEMLPGADCLACHDGSGGGLAPDARVVASGGGFLGDGDTVRVVAK